MLDKEESKARVMLDTRKKRRFLNPQKQQQLRTTHHIPLTTTKCFRTARIFGREKEQQNRIAQEKMTTTTHDD